MAQAKDSLTRSRYISPSTEILIPFFQEKAFVGFDDPLDRSQFVSFHSFRVNQPHRIQTEFGVLAFAFHDMDMRIVRMVGKIPCVEPVAECAFR